MGLTSGSRSSSSAHHLGLHSGFQIIGAAAAGDRLSSWRRAQEFKKLDLTMKVYLNHLHRHAWLLPLAKQVTLSNQVAEEHEQITMKAGTHNALP